MTNPFDNRSLAMSGPARDIMPVTPDDANNLTTAAVALYVEGAGAIAFVSASGDTRTVNVTDYTILPVGVVRVLVAFYAQGVLA